MPNKKYLNMLGLARRAGKLSMGHDMAMKAIATKKAQLILFACDVSPRLIEEFNIACEKYNENLRAVSLEENMNELHMALGYKAGVMTVDDINFSDRIIELINQEG